MTVKGLYKSILLYMILNNLLNNVKFEDLSNTLENKRYQISNCRTVSLMILKLHTSCLACNHTDRNKIVTNESEKKHGFLSTIQVVHDIKNRSFVLACTYTQICKYLGATEIIALMCVLTMSLMIITPLKSTFPSVSGFFQFYCR